MPGQNPPKYNMTHRDSVDKRRKFIAALKATGNVGKSAATAGVAKSTVYEWRRKWRSFAKAWEEAILEASHDFMDKAREMVFDDDDVPHATKAKLIETHLKAYFPERFNPQSSSFFRAETTSEGGSVVTVARVAPGVIDRLLDDSPLLEDPDRVEYVDDPDEPDAIEGEFTVTEREDEHGKDG